jgi:formylglycine-generating enzyme required for sulfatase activity
MTRSTLAALLGVVGAALVAGVIALARSRAEPPARCAVGMVALGPRCCGEGQRLEGDRCAGTPRRCAEGTEVTPLGCVARPRVVAIAGGRLRVGPGDWEAQGVVAPYEAEVAPFRVDATEVTEQRWSACVTAGGCAVLPLSREPGRAASRMTFDEAVAFCRWAGGALPSSDQLAFAAAGARARRYAWGDTGAVCRRAAFGLVAGPCGWGAEGPEIAGTHPDGASPEGVLDLAGNVAEWAAGAGGDAEVRGGSFADAAASALRSWQRRAVPRETRSSEIGLRCVYAAE